MGQAVYLVEFQVALMPCICGALFGLHDDVEDSRESEKTGGSPGFPCDTYLPCDFGSPGFPKWIEPTWLKQPRHYPRELVSFETSYSAGSVGVASKVTTWFSRWWFQIFFNFHPETWGNDPIWRLRVYFENGLVKNHQPYDFCGIINARTSGSPGQRSGGSIVPATLSALKRWRVDGLMAYLLKRDSPTQVHQANSQMHYIYIYNIYIYIFTYTCPYR